MPKLNAKAIREEARKEFTRAHKEELERLRASHKEVLSKVRIISNNYNKVIQENEKLKEQIRVQKEWIERLMDFVNMPDDERHMAIQEYVTNKRLTEDFREMFAPYFSALNRLNKYFP